jgi:hypothetical protein
MNAIVAKRHQKILSARGYSSKKSTPITVSVKSWCPSRFGSAQDSPTTHSSTGRTEGRHTKYCMKELGCEERGREREKYPGPQIVR